MSGDEALHREERVAIMTILGGCAEEEAQGYCDGLPVLYGIREREECQLELL